MSGVPLKSWFYHGVKLTKWENEFNGRKSVSFSIEKSYKDKTTNEYKQSKSFYSDDLDSLLHCILLAKQDSVKVINPRGQSAVPQAPYQDGSVPDDQIPPMPDPNDDVVPF